MAQYERMARWIAFFIAIAVGAAGGLLYGWLVNPVKYVDTSPSSLRIDFKSDYVLMVAESYRADGNLALAVQRLSGLEEQPVESVSQAVAFAEEHGYGETDLTAMKSLLEALQNWNPSGGETPSP